MPDLASLGAREVADLLHEGGGLEGEARAERVRTAGERRVLRYPLPGTVHRAGEKPSAPRGAGTGFVYLTRWDGGSLRSKTTARLTTPRSSSFAARAWNLYCHLREHGVGTAEPMAMGEEGSPLFSSRSFLVTRALDNMRPLPVVLREGTGAVERRRLAQALGLFLGRIADARVRLPRLKLSAIFVARTPGGGSCGGASPVPGLARRALPELALATVNGGRILESWRREDSLEFLQQLAAQVDGDWRLDGRDIQRVRRHATAGLEAAERRSLARSLPSLTEPAPIPER